MKPARLPLLVLFLCLLSASCLGFVLRKRSWNEDDSNRLADALKVIERERRRLSDTTQESSDPYNDPYSEEAYLPEYEPELSDDVLSQKEEDLLRDILESPSASEGLAEEYYPEDESLLTTDTPVDDSELEDILEPSAEEEEGELAEENLKEKKEYDPSEGFTLKKKDNDDVVELSDDEVNKLLNDIKEKEVEALKQEVEEEVEKEQEEEARAQAEADEEMPSEPVSEEELKSVLEDEGIPSLNKEYLTDELALSKSDTSVKRKRSNGMPQSEAEESEEDALENAAVDLEYIKEFLRMEDEENTYLANALNLATIGQVDRTDKYIPAEVDLLRKAIETESKIQDLRESLGMSAARPKLQDTITAIADEIPSQSKRAEEDELEQEEFADAERKQLLAEKFREYLDRNGEDLYPATGEVEEEGEWLDQPVEDEGLTDEELWERYNSGGVDKRGGGDEEETIGEGAFEPEDEEEEEELEEEIDNEVENEIENTLVRYVSKMSPVERAELKFAVESEIAALEEGMCPAIEMADNCEFARKAGLTLDSEALDLCNRHQICYACGSAQDMSRDACDHGFMSEANQLCEGDAECKDQASNLYLIMLAGHQYVPADETRNYCSDQCTADYVSGLYGNK